MLKLIFATLLALGGAFTAVAATGFDDAITEPSSSESDDPTKIYVGVGNLDPEIQAYSVLYNRTLVGYLIPKNLDTTQYLTVLNRINQSKQTPFAYDCNQHFDLNVRNVNEANEIFKNLKKYEGSKRARKITKRAGKSGKSIDSSDIIVCSKGNALFFRLQWCANNCSNDKECTPDCKKLCDPLAKKHQSIKACIKSLKKKSGWWPRGSSKKSKKA